MKILGISCYYHDAAAALIIDGKLIAAAEEERFSRKKHDSGFPSMAINFCLQMGGIVSSDLDYVVFYEKPFKKFERILISCLETYPHSFGLFKEAMSVWGKEKLWVKEIIAERLGISTQKVRFVEHHKSHAASAFLCSPFEEAAIMTVDGAGEWATQTLGIGRGNSIHLMKEQRFPHSVGLIYSAFTAFLGFEVNEGEYKVMGMAPYGIPRFTDKILDILSIADDGSFRLDMKYFTYHYHTRDSFNKKFEAVFGKPRRYGSRFVTDKTSIYDDKNPPDAEEINSNQYYADIAASIQKVTEEILVRTARYLYELSGGIRNICIAGGVGLNCVANSRILADTSFDKIFVQPAAGDSGGALGAALYFYNCVLQNERTILLDNPYLGASYSDDKIGDFVKTGINGCVVTRTRDEDELVKKVATHIESGKVIGWFQDRFEWGPRALGNRSILADPRRQDMKDIVNIKIKFREPYRPFAPSVIEEEAENYFELEKGVQSPMYFMLMTLKVKPDKREVIPAVTHVDGSARIQMVAKNSNPLYYRLIKQFGLQTGVPVLLNTSFNLKGEPIVNTPANAYKTFMNSGMDVLVLGRYIIEKRGQI